MTNRSPYDSTNPSPREELLGLCHGILSAEVTADVAMLALEQWLVRHLTDGELERLAVRDPAWLPWDKSDAAPSARFFAEWALRLKDGQVLPPVPGSQYKPQFQIVG